MNQDSYNFILALVKLLPNSLQGWVIVGLFAVATIAGIVWLWRGKQKKDDDKPSNTRSVSVGGSVTHSPIITGDNDRVNSDKE